MAELRSAIFWVLNCPIYLLRCYRYASKAHTSKYMCKINYPNPKSFAPAGRNFSGLGMRIADTSTF
ncbi:MAG: hypothetical protein IM583_13670 [Pseudanabaena sp. M114S2SP2A07QC]|nr:hypothetical protein [Pseudanabaena sp. M090S1SP2A07QC]MCA6505548.1 hypothetical protein [Pseudanabaena sp. M172S2SP2A07QC]MCA6523091.1 hypothetical protein [Pseudanabaena sp. M051S1SP2A07QC]MCA6524635.1 hypothetical protein [Pseudanabaena sp. M179S2SP2A07QC]MCA6533581.1 hypothetical protein [Pseudanabaena sp. M176S2SP2A07QC]MCA6537950.1 hypothetical protein [Pseudanabaena sp. M037S2SP2A07QC]MCA6557637.1 hypothetical protein [Pseudanabaena sp. M114S2SP2A07QC]MCA6561019.1 hypothetical prot